MKANIEIFIRTMLEVAIGEKVPQTVGVNWRYDTIKKQTKKTVKECI